MRFGKVILIAALVAMLVVVGITGEVLAGNPGPTPGTIVGPELWGVIIIDEPNDILTLRVKRIVDCNVVTQSWVGPYGLGTPTEANAISQKLPIQLWDINPNPASLTPIITKVKNFKQDVGGAGQAVYSFDAQIKFEQQ